MEKIKEFLNKHKATVLGFFLGVLAAFPAGGTMDLGAAIGVALDKDKQLAQCSSILEQVPAEEVDEAVEAEDVNINVE